MIELLLAAGYEPVTYASAQETDGDAVYTVSCLLVEGWQDACVPVPSACPAGLQAASLCHQPDALPCRALQHENFCPARGWGHGEADQYECLGWFSCPRDGRLT